jgi:hypothetical protein
MLIGGEIVRASRRLGPTQTGVRIWHFGRGEHPHGWRRAGTILDKAAHFGQWVNPTSVASRTASATVAIDQNRAKQASAADDDLLLRFRPQPGPALSAALGWVRCAAPGGEADGR